MMDRSSVLLCAACMIFCFAGCDKDSDSANNNGISRDDHEGRGSEACQDWQFAYCEYAYTTCDFDLPETMEECLDQYASLVCISDDSASTCAETLNNASCSDVPEDCMYTYIADPAPAIEQCNQYVETVCTRDVGCGGGTVEECVADYGPKVGCDQVIGTFMIFEECITKIENTGCTDLLPDECGTLFLM